MSEPLMCGFGIVVGFSAALKEYMVANATQRHAQPATRSHAQPRAAQQRDN